MQTMEILLNEQKWELKGPVFEREFYLKNNGEDVVLHIYPQEESDGYWLEVDEAFFSLFPGESKKVKITALKKQGGGFLSQDRKEVDRPRITFRSFN